MDLIDMGTSVPKAPLCGDSGWRLGLRVSKLVSNSGADHENDSDDFKLRVYAPDGVGSGYAVTLTSTGRDGTTQLGQVTITMIAGPGGEYHVSDNPVRLVSDTVDRDGINTNMNALLELEHILLDAEHEDWSDVSSLSQYLWYTVHRWSDGRWHVDVEYGQCH